MRPRIITAALALALALAGAAMLLRANSGLTVHETTVSGVPLTEVRSAASSGARGLPGVVVAHGFAGSARLMMPFADTLARRGFVVVMLDFAGHGRNTSTGQGGELDIAVRHLRSLSGVDGSRISLVGHSMGAGAVTHYAATHRGISSTVAISLGAPVDAPQRLLLIVGGLEFAHFRRVAADTAASSNMRRLVTVPGVEHISVLYAPRTHNEILRWLGAPPGPAPLPWLRVLGGALLLLGFALGLYPLTTLLPRGPASPEAPPPLSSLLAAPVAAIAAILAAAPFNLAVGAYVGVFAAVCGLTMVAWARLRGRMPRSGTLFWSSLIFIGYPILSIAAPIHFGLTHALPTGPRWLLLPAMVGAFALLGLGTISLTGGRFWPTAAVFACATVLLLAAARTGLAPGFLTLIIPLLVVLLGWQAVWTAMLTRAGAPIWLIAVAGAVLPAWPTATAMPL